MRSDESRGTARHRPPITNTHPALPHPGEFGRKGSDFVLRWAWRLDDAANRLTVVTGRWAARAVFRDLHRRGEA